MGIWDSLFGKSKAKKNENSPFFPKQDDPLDADVIVSTCHRSKGLEWDVVVLEEDFPDIFDEEKITPDQRIDELNLLLWNKVFKKTTFYNWTRSVM